MAWQFIIILQIIVSSIMTLYIRRVTLSVKKVNFLIGIFSYLSIAICGLLLSTLNNHGMPSLPSGIVWSYILIEGFCVPLAWYCQYRLIRYIGASNTVMVSTINTVGAALLGIIFLRELLVAAFVVGVIFILGSAYISLGLQPDLKHHPKVSFKTKLMLASGSFIFFSFGMFFEKLAIDKIGVWNYSCYGWGMQFIGAFLIFILLGRNEIIHLTTKVVRSGLLIGVVTSVSGALYIWAISRGSFSHTIVATSGKVAVTMVLSALFLKERNQLSQRLMAFTLTTIGIVLILF